MGGRYFVSSLLLLAMPAAATSLTDAAYEFATAKLLAGQGAYTAALQAFQRAVELAPEEPYLRLEQAQLLFRLGDLAGALEAAEASRGGGPRNRAVQRDPDSLEQAIEIHEELLNSLPDDVETLVTLGRLYQIAERPEQAAEVLRRAISLRPGSERAYSMLVRALIDSGAEREAEETLAGLLAEDASSLDRRFLLVDLQSDRGDHQSAVETLRGAPPEVLADGRVKRRLAYELYQAGMLEESLEVVDETLEKSWDTHLRLLRARLLVALGRREEALAGLSSLFAEDPANLEIGLPLARLKAEVGAAAEAGALLEELAQRLRDAGRRNEADQAWLQLATLLAADEDWNGVLRAVGFLQSPDADQAGLLLKVDALLELGQSEQALEALETPDVEQLPALLSRRAEALFRLGRGMEGAEVVDRILGDRSPANLRAAALLFQKLERYEDSLPILEELVTTSPDSVEARFLLGAAFERTGRREEAASEFLRLLEQAPDFHPALNYLGYMWAEKGENLEHALRLVKRAVVLSPDNGAYEDSLGWAHYRLGDYEEARHHLERAAALSPNEAVILEHLGDLYRALGETAKAREIYRRALELSRDNIEQIRAKLEDLETGVGASEQR